MKLTPTAGRVALRPILPSDARAEAVFKRSGLYVAKPTNSGSSFEGIPDQGRVYALPDGYDGDLKIGDRVVFNEKQPKGIRWEGEALFILELDQIVGTIPEGEA